MIEPVHNMVYLCLRQRIQSHAFRHILANQSIGFLVEPPLPGMIGMGKIYGRLQCLAIRTWWANSLPLSAVDVDTTYAGRLIGPDVLVDAFRT